MEGEEEVASRKTQLLDFRVTPTAPKGKVYQSLLQPNNLLHLVHSNVPRLTAPRKVVLSIPWHA